MLTEKVIMNEQEFSDNHYQFFGVPMVCTPAFRDAFGEDYDLVAFAAQQMIAEKYPDKNWDYLQTFSYCIEEEVPEEHANGVKRNGGMQQTQMNEAMAKLRQSLRTED